MADWPGRSKFTFALTLFSHFAAVLWLFLFVLQVYCPDWPLLKEMFQPDLHLFYNQTSDGHYEQCIWHQQTKNISIVAIASAAILFCFMIYHAIYFLFGLFGCCSAINDNYITLMLFQLIYGLVWFVIISINIFYVIIDVPKYKNNESLWPWTLECHLKCHPVAQIPIGLMSDVKCESSSAVPSLVVIGVESALIIANGVLHAFTWRLAGIALTEAQE